MDTANLRNRFLIHWSKTVVVGLLLVAGHVVAPDARAQGSYRYVRKHLEAYDDKPIHYGFFFALPSTRYTVRYTPAFAQATTDSAYRVYSPSRMGFRLGFVFNAFLNDRFDFRLTPAVSLYTRQVLQDYPGGQTLTRTRESTWVEFPLLLKYKSDRRNNSRMYLLAGATLGVEANARRREVAGATRLSTATTDLSIDYGLGFEQFFQYFKFAPELRFSHGVPNLFRPTPNTPNEPIRRLTSHTVTVYLNFE